MDEEIHSESKTQLAFAESAKPRNHDVRDCPHLLLLSFNSQPLQCPSFQVSQTTK